MNLNQLAIKHGSDKRSDIHDYAKLYEQYFAARRLEKITILEIGVFGGASLKMWRDYFPNAEIIGVDINPDAKGYESGRVKIEIGDQSDSAFLEEISNVYGDWDIIIDDGSHATAHHIASYNALINHLKPGGFYIIEDLHTCYWPAYSQGVNSIDVIAPPIIHAVQMNGKSGYGNIFGPAASSDRGEHGLNDSLEKSTGADLTFEFIHFYKSILFIKKR